MIREDFMRIFIDVSSKIVELGIDKGYFDSNRKQELKDKLDNIINKEIQELDDSQGLALFNPNDETISFNMKQITTEEDAITLIFHEEKHVLDKYSDWDDIQHIDNSHVGFHQQYSNFGQGQNESVTDRFAINMTKLFKNKDIPTTTFNAFNLNFQTDMVRYQVEDRLNQLFCVSMGLTLDELISMQNDKNMDRLNELISKFNEGAEYERFSSAMDGIYELRYGVNGKEDADFLEEDIQRMHEYIQLAQDEFERYIMYQNPERLEEIRKTFISTNPKYKIDEERKSSLVNSIHGVRQKDTNDSSTADMISMLRMELLESGVEATISSVTSEQIKKATTIIIQEHQNDRTEIEEDIRQ